MCKWESILLPALEPQAGMPTAPGWNPGTNESVTGVLASPGKHNPGEDAACCTPRPTDYEELGGSLPGLLQVVWGALASPKKRPDHTFWGVCLPHWPAAAVLGGILQSAMLLLHLGGLLLGAVGLLRTLLRGHCNQRGQFALRSCPFALL